jgi:hypothetical protein
MSGRLIDALFGDYDFSGKTGIEFGALSRPLLRGMAEMRYADHLPTDRLKQKYENDPSICQVDVVDVDYVVDGSARLRETIPASVVFDFAAGSHVGEHVPDFLGWLSEIADVLVGEGRIFLVLPDKRRCFDIARPPSTTADVVGAWLEKRRKPGPATVFSGMVELYNFDGKPAWPGIKPLSRLKRTGGPRQALASSQRCLDQYIDVHCWVFTPLSFMRIVNDLCELAIFPFKVTRFRVPRRRGPAEFYVALQKCGDQHEIRRSAAEALEIARRDGRSPWLAKIRDILP